MIEGYRVSLSPRTPMASMVVEPSPKDGTPPAALHTRFPVSGYRVAPLHAVSLLMPYTFRLQLQQQHCCKVLPPSLK